MSIKEMFNNAKVNEIYFYTLLFLFGYVSMFYPQVIVNGINNLSAVITVVSAYALPIVLFILIIALVKSLIFSKP